jgi:hypothetical protein
LLQIESIEHCVSEVIVILTYKAVLGQNGKGILNLFYLLLTLIDQLFGTQGASPNENAANRLQHVLAKVTFDNMFGK